MAKTKPLPAEDTEAASELVIVRVTKMGDGKVSNGHHFPGLGDEFYEKDETFDISSDIALELEGRGLVEIQDAKPKSGAAA